MIGDDNYLTDEDRAVMGTISAPTQAEKVESFAAYEARLARENKTRARKESQVNPKRK